MAAPLVVLEVYVSSSIITGSPPGYRVSVLSDGTMRCGGSYLDSQGRQTIITCTGVASDQPCRHIATVIRDEKVMGDIWGLGWFGDARKALQRLADGVYGAARPPVSPTPSPVDTRYVVQVTGSVLRFPPGWAIGLGSDGSVTCNGEFDARGVYQSIPCPTDPLCQHVLMTLRDTKTLSDFLEALRGLGRAGAAGKRLAELSIIANANKGIEEERDMPAVATQTDTQTRTPGTYPFLMKKITNTETGRSFSVVLEQRVPNGPLFARSCRTTPASGRSLGCSDFALDGGCSHSAIAQMRVTPRETGLLLTWWERGQGVIDLGTRSWNGGSSQKEESPAPEEEEARYRAVLPEDRTRVERGRLVLAGKLPRSHKRQIRPKLEL